MAATSFFILAPGVGLGTLQGIDNRQLVENVFCAVIRFCPVAFFVAQNPAHGAATPIIPSPISGSPSKPAQALGCPELLESFRLPIDTIVRGEIEIVETADAHGCRFLTQLVEIIA